jgi:STAS domain
MTVEVVGSVFFGSALYILQRIMDEAGIDLEDKRGQRVVTGDSHVEAISQRRHSFLVSDGVGDSLSVRKSKREYGVKRQPAKFVVLDLTKVTNVDGMSC